MLRLSLKLKQKQKASKTATLSHDNSSSPKEDTLLAHSYRNLIYHFIVLTLPLSVTTTAPASARAGLGVTWLMVSQSPVTCSEKWSNCCLEIFQLRQLSNGPKLDFSVKKLDNKRGAKKEARTWGPYYKTLWVHFLRHGRKFEEYCTININ